MFRITRSKTRLDLVVLGVSGGLRSRRTRQKVELVSTDQHLSADFLQKHRFILHIVRDIARLNLPPRPIDGMTEKKAIADGRTVFE